MFLTLAIVTRNSYALLFTLREAIPLLTDTIPATAVGVVETIAVQYILQEDMAIKAVRATKTAVVQK